MAEDRIIVEDTLKGQYRVQRTNVALKDPSRTGWNDEPERDLMISLFCPLEVCFREDLCDYISPVTLSYVEKQSREAGFQFPDHFYDGVSVRYFCGMPKKRRPVLVFSPGFRISRHFHTVQARDLASHGYVVITVDHPGETLVVEFPDHVAEGLPTDDRDPELVAKALKFREGDFRFIIDQLMQEHPLGLSGMRHRIDPKNILAFGHSLGGAAALSATYHDIRISGCLDFDGRPKGALTSSSASLDGRPFFYVGATDDSVSGACDLIARSHCSHAVLIINNITHVSFFDVPYLITRRKDVVKDQGEWLNKWFGKLDGFKMRKLQFMITRVAAELAFHGDMKPWSNLFNNDSSSDTVVNLFELVRTDILG